MALARYPRGRPSVRNVLLKGVDDRGFVFYTNYQSRKAQELAATGRASLLFTWRSLERQVRGRDRREGLRRRVRRLLCKPSDREPWSCMSRQSEVVDSRDTLELLFSMLPVSA